MRRCCSGIVLGYHGCFVSLEELRSECGVSRDGSKASNMVKAARRYGLEAKGFRNEPDELRALAAPFIVFWNFNHFLVVEGFVKDKVYLNDPGSGPRIVSAIEFDESFTGVVLTFTPTEQFRKKGEKPRVAKLIKNRLASSRLGLVFAVLIGLALVIPGLLTPTYTKIFVDNVLLNGLESWVRPLLLTMSITALIVGVLTWMQQYFLLRMETRLAIASAGQFFWHILHLPVEFFIQRSSGDTASRVGLNDSVASMLSGSLATSFLNIILALFYVALMLFYDVALTLIGVSMAALNILVLLYVARKRTDDNRRLVTEHGKLMGTTMNGLSIIETLKATGAESDFFSRWAGYHAKVMNAQQELARSSMMLAIIPAFLSTLNIALIIGIGGQRVMDGMLTIGMLIAYQSLMSSFMKPVNSLVNLAAEMQSLEGTVNRLDDVLRYPCDPVIKQYDNPPPAAANHDSKLAGYLELKNITFGYSRLEAPLLSDFSLYLEPGMRVALVGTSGSGKSTIAKLVMGLYKPWSGEILFDGLPREQVPPEKLNSSFAMVDQDIVVLEGTLRDNLTLWDKTISDADIVRAAKDAEIHDVISSRSKGYDGPMQEGGGNMSGGQLQRMEIARTLTINPTILVMDEATSALDPVTEKRVDGNIRRRGCTCLIVAHRLSTIRDCDEIIVMDKGKVAERGTHDQLYALNGVYAGLIKS